MEKKQLYEKKKQCFDPFYPITDVTAIFDDDKNLTLAKLVGNFNHYYIEDTGSVTGNRAAVPSFLRRNGIWISYNYRGVQRTEYFKGTNAEARLDNKWLNDDYWGIVAFCNCSKDGDSGKDNPGGDNPGDNPGGDTPYNPPVNTTPNWQRTGNTKCEQGTNGNTGYLVYEEKDINANSSTYNNTRWTDKVYNITACPISKIPSAKDVNPKWVALDEYSCVTDSDGNNTGECKCKYKDDNQYSDTYGQTKWESIGTDTIRCPLPTKPETKEPKSFQIIVDNKSSIAELNGTYGVELDDGNHNGIEWSVSKIGQTIIKNVIFYDVASILSKSCTNDNIYVDVTYDRNNPKNVIAYLTLTDISPSEPSASTNKKCLVTYNIAEDAKSLFTSIPVEGISDLGKVSITVTPTSTTDEYEYKNTNPDLSIKNAPNPIDALNKVDVVIGEPTASSVEGYDIERTITITSKGGGTTRVDDSESTKEKKTGTINITNNSSKDISVHVPYTDSEGTSKYKDVTCNANGKNTESIEYYDNISFGTPTFNNGDGSYEFDGNPTIDGDKMAITVKVKEQPKQQKTYTIQIEGVQDVGDIKVIFNKDSMVGVHTVTIDTDNGTYETLTTSDTLQQTAISITDVSGYSHDGGKWDSTHSTYTITYTANSDDTTTYNASIDLLNNTDNSIEVIFRPVIDGTTGEVVKVPLQGIGGENKKTLHYTYTSDFDVTGVSSNPSTPSNINRGLNNKNISITFADDY